jgi:hypothetical protein
MRKSGFHTDKYQVSSSDPGKLEKVIETGNIVRRAYLRIVKPHRHPWRSTFMRKPSTGGENTQPA